MYPMKISKNFHKIQKKNNNIFLLLTSSKRLCFIPLKHMKPSFARYNKMNTLKILKNQYYISFITKKIRNFLIVGIYYLHISLVALKRADKGFEENVNVDINILSTTALTSNLKIIKKLQFKEYY